MQDSARPRAQRNTAIVTFAEAGSFELGTDGPTVILVGIDGSTTSLRAGAYAAGLARRQRARLVAVYVGAVSSISAAAPGAGGLSAISLCPEGTSRRHGSCHQHYP